MADTDMERETLSFEGRREEMDVCGERFVLVDCPVQV